MNTKKEVVQWCEANGIAISIEKWEGAVNHVHLDIDAPHKVFRSVGTHNLAVWDSLDPIDWRAVGKEIVLADFGECTDPACEYCYEVTAL